MKRIVGYPDKSTAESIVNSKDGKKHKCVVKRHKVNIFGKKVNEWGVFCRK